MSPSRLGHLEPLHCRARRFTTTRLPCGRDEEQYLEFRDLDAQIEHFSQLPVPLLPCLPQACRDGLPDGEERVADAHRSSPRSGAISSKSSVQDITTAAGPTWDVRLAAWVSTSAPSAAFA